MSGISRVRLIGLGEVGQILARDLAAAGVDHITAWDVAFADEASGPSRAVSACGVHAASTPTDAAREAEVIISAVTAAEDVTAARAVAPGIARGAIYLDLNSASPGQKRASAEVVEAAGGRYVEAAVMSPFPPRRLASPMLLGGPHAAEALEALQALGFTGAEVFSDQVGGAAAAKLCRSVMVKGIEALLTESLLTARCYGVEGVVLDSLSDLLPIPDWESTARYMISRSLEHGTRRAEEMREASRTVGEAGVDPIMSDATAERQDQAAVHRSAQGAPGLGAMLDAILAGMKTTGGET